MRVRVTHKIDNSIVGTEDGIHPPPVNASSDPGSSDAGMWTIKNLAVKSWELNKTRTGKRINWDARIVGSQFFVLRIQNWTEVGAHLGRSQCRDEA